MYASRYTCDYKGNYLVKPVGGWGAHSTICICECKYACEHVCGST